MSWPKDIHKQRNADIRADRRSGVPAWELGRIYGLTRGRIDQIIHDDPDRLAWNEQRAADNAWLRGNYE